MIEYVCFAWLGIQFMYQLHDRNHRMGFSLIGLFSIFDSEHEGDQLAQELHEEVLPLDQEGFEDVVGDYFQ